MYRDATGFLTYISMAMISPVKNKHSIGFIHSGNQNSESPGNDKLDEDVDADSDDLQKTPMMKRGLRQETTTSGSHHSSITPY